MISTTSVSNGSMTARKLLTVDLSQAERDYLISNTPLFLLRKLRDNSVVKNMAQGASSTSLLSALRSSLKHEPRSLATAVRPYAYLVALSMQQQPAFWKRAAALNAPHHQWFKFMAEVLSETGTTGTSRVTLSLAPPPHLASLDSR